MEKSCTVCKMIKPLDQYHKDKKSKDGHNAQCKPCRAEKNKQYYARPEARAKILKRSREYHKKHADQRRQRARDWHEANKDDRYFDGRLKRVYGISKTEYEILLNEQNNLCAVCKNPETAIHNKTRKVKRLAVDHCHKTSQVRGLLCHACNTSLGAFKDNIEILKEAINYLEFYKESYNADVSSVSSEDC